MTNEIPDDIKTFALKRRSFRSRADGVSLRYVNLTEEESKRLFEFAHQRGLLTRYEFSGVTSYGVTRNNAADRLLKETRQKAFDLLRRAFGASARFRKQEWNPWTADFYWKKAGLAVVITGPGWDDLRRADPTRRRDTRPELYEEISSPSGLSDCPAKISKLLKMPYYMIWHQPTRFIDQVRLELIASGQYPKLIAK